MSYLAFHLVFILPPIAVLALSTRARGGLAPGELRALGLVMLIALMYTTPWDNYLVWRGIWSYGSDRVLGTIGYVPVEEYLFFLLQPVLTGLWLLLLLHRRGEPRAVGGKPRVVGALAFVLVAAVGVAALGHEGGAYLGLILVWAAPVLAGQWAYAGSALWAHRRVWLLGVAVPTLYLWIADALAIRMGIWRISAEHTLGPALGGLPLEEAVFFLVTNLLVVQGLLLFVRPPASSRGPAAARPLSA